MASLPEQTQTHKSWLWPDKVISKRESRELREEHNRLVNSHAELLATCVRIAERRFLIDDDADECNQMVEVARAAIAKAEAGKQVPA